MIKTVKIPEPNVEVFEKKMQKLVKLSKKLDSGSINYQLLSRKLEKQGEDSYMVYHEYEIAGETPTLGGYKLVAYLEHIGDKNLVKHIDKTIALPEGLEERENYCEHCHNNRQRVHLFILEEESTGEQIQVGRTCVKDFTGWHQNPEQVAEWYQGISMVDEFESLGSFSGFVNYRYDALKVIAHSAYHTDKHGYRKSADGTTDSPSTAKRTRESMNNLDSKTLEDEGYYTKAEEVLEWILGKSITEYGYFRDLKTLAEIGVVPSDKIGIMASAYHVFGKEIQKKQEKKVEQEENHETKPESNFVGIVGERKVHQLIFDRQITFDTEYGYMGIQFFHDKDGNVYLWKTSKYLSFEAGEQVMLNGTMKEHSEYNGIKQNVLTRCKVVD